MSQLLRMNQMVGRRLTSDREYSSSNLARRFRGAGIETRVLVGLGYAVEKSLRDAGVSS